MHVETQSVARKRCVLPGDREQVCVSKKYTVAFVWELTKEPSIRPWVASRAV